MTRASQVRSWLRDVTEWRAALPDVTAALLGLHSPRPAPRPVRGGDGRLPFRLDEVTDDLDDGAAGIRTSAGLGWLLDHWAVSVHGDRVGRPHPEGTRAADLGITSPAAYLTDMADWAAAHAPDWEDLCEDVGRAHHWLAGVTGHAPVHVGPCPTCGGPVSSYPGRTGTPDHGVCTGACGTWWPDAARAVASAARHAMRSATVPDGAVVTMAELATIWAPDVPRRTLETWAQRGVLARRTDDRGRTVYPLRDTNLVIRLRLRLARSG